MSVQDLRTHCEIRSRQLDAQYGLVVLENVLGCLFGRQATAPEAISCGKEDGNDDDDAADRDHDGQALSDPFDGSGPKVGVGTCYSGALRDADAAVSAFCSRKAVI